MPFVERLVYARRRPFIKRLVREVLALYCVEFPPEAKVGPGLSLPHRGFGVVISGRARIGVDVTIYQGVTLGQADVYNSTPEMDEIAIGDSVILGAGAKVLANKGTLQVHRGCVIGANSVMLRSTTGENEVWAGAPARRVGFRSQPGVG